MKKILLFLLVCLLLAASPALYLNDLFDVSLISPSRGQFLMYNDDGWTNSVFALTTTGNITQPSAGALTDGAELGAISATTDGSGDVTVYHGLNSTTPAVTVEVDGTTPYLTSVHTKTAYSFKVRFFEVDSTGSPTPAPLVSTAVTGSWKAQIPNTHHFLDHFPGATRAFALMLLDKDYAGGLVSIRKAGGTSYKTFYPDANKVLSLTSVDSAGVALSTYIGSSSGYIARWLDQSGSGYNAVTTDTTLQPKIVNAGTVVTSGGKPAATWASDALTFTEISSTNLTVITIGDISAVGSSQAIILGGEATTDFFSYRSNSTTNQVKFGGGTTKSFTSADTRTRQMIFFTMGNTTSEMWENGSSLGTTTNFSGLTGKLRHIGQWRVAAPYYYAGEIQAIIIYPTDQTAKQAAMQTELNSKYSIY